MDFKMESTNDDWFVLLFVFKPSENNVELQLLLRKAYRTLQNGENAV